MARLQILDLPIEVRILAGQQMHCGCGIEDFGLLHNPHSTIRNPKLQPGLIV